MKIGFFSEAGYQGGVPRNHPNMRTDVAWVCALGAEHIPLPLIREVKKDTFDVGIVIIPKNKQVVQQFNMMEELKRVCKKICIMQESTYSYWQDDEIGTQVWYYNCLFEADLILCHNDVDLKYYRGLTQKRCELLQSVMITDNLDGNDIGNDPLNVEIIDGPETRYKKVIMESLVDEYSCNKESEILQIKKINKREIFEVNCIKEVKRNDF